MKATLISLLLLCSAATITARPLSIPFAAITRITSISPQGKYTVLFTHPTTKQPTLATLTMADYQKLMKATFNPATITPRCTLTRGTLTVTLNRKSNS